MTAEQRTALPNGQTSRGKTTADKFEPVGVQSQRAPSPPCADRNVSHNRATSDRPIPYDPDLGPVEITEFPGAAKRWSKAVNRGQWLAHPEDGAPPYHEVFMLELGGRYRFVGWGGRQYGPEHRDLVTAVYWAFAHGWLDPQLSHEDNVRCHVEMRTESRLRGQGIDPDAWRPHGTEARQ